MNKGIYEKVNFNVSERWKVNYNRLLKLDPSQIGELDDDIWIEYSVDMLNMVNEEDNIMLDIGWYPEFSRKGSYGLVLIEDNDWQRPIETFVTKNTEELVNRIEEILDKY